MKTGKEKDSTYKGFVTLNGVRHDGENRAGLVQNEQYHTMLKLYSGCFNPTAAVGDMKIFYYKTNDGNGMRKS